MRGFTISLSDILYSLILFPQIQVLDRVNEIKTNEVCRDVKIYLFYLRQNISYVSNEILAIFGFDQCKCRYPAFAEIDMSVIASKYIRV
jgi:hypothetical protein